MSSLQPTPRSPVGPLRRGAGARYLQALPAPPAKDKKKHDPGAWVKGRNEPASMPRVLAVLAGHRGEEDAGAVAAAAYDNAQRLFFSGRPEQRA